MNHHIGKLNKPWWLWAVAVGVPRVKMTGLNKMVARMLPSMGPLPQTFRELPRNAAVDGNTGLKRLQQALWNTANIPQATLRMPCNRPVQTSPGVEARVLHPGSRASDVDAGVCGPKRKPSAGREFLLRRSACKAASQGLESCLCHWIERPRLP